MQTDPKETTMIRPALVVPADIPFIMILHHAMKTARLHGIDDVAMIADVQSVPSIKERKEKLAKYFEVI